MYQKDFHPILNSFSTKLKALRNAYGITLSETAALLNVGAKSTIFEWEKQRKMPSIENLNMISTVFGVPTDWLLGHTETLYSNESITWTEGHLHISFWNRYLHEYYPEYADPQKRVQYYSLPVRANIAVLMCQVRLSSLYWRMYYAQNGFKKRGVIAKVKEFFHMSEEEAEEFKPPGRKELERGDNLVRLLTLSKINYTPVQKKALIYDVEAAYQNLIVGEQK